MLAHRLAERWRWVRREGSVVDFLRPDGKTQVTVEYVGRQAGAHRHRGDVHAAHRRTSKEAQCARTSTRRSSTRSMPAEAGSDADHRVTTSTPRAGSSIGGPHGDSGLTGRKIIVDTYGGMGRHGGGAFSGQGPVQGGSHRASYAARYIAKNMVAAEPGRRGARCRSAYAIGVAEPVSVMVDTFGTGHDRRREDREARPRHLRSDADGASSST